MRVTCLCLSLLPAAGNIAIRYPKDALFNVKSPADKYDHLDLSDPYQRAVCMKLLDTVATNSFYALEYMQYRAPGSKVFESINVAQTTYTVPESELEDEQGK